MDNQRRSRCLGDDMTFRQDPIPSLPRQRHRYNPEKRCWRGNSYNKGGSLVRDLRDRAAYGDVEVIVVRRSRRPRDD